MSRTDVHRPWHVQVADPYNRHLLYRFQEWPTQPPKLIPFRNFGCGCSLCTAKYERRRDRRRERHESRRALRQGTY